MWNWKTSNTSQLSNIIGAPTLNYMYSSFSKSCTPRASQIFTSYEVVCQLAPLGSKVLTTCTECVITTGGNISPEIYIFTKLTAYSKFLYNLCITQLQWNLTLPSISALPTSKVFKNFIKICSSVISPFWYFGCILTL